MTTLHYLLSTPTWLDRLFFPVLALCILASLKAAWVVGRMGWKFLRTVSLRASAGNALLICVTGYALYLWRDGLAELLESPVYFGQYDSVGTEYEAAIFEQELVKRNPVTMVTDEVKRATTETAAKLGVPRLWIYECALGECGLNPFVVRPDRVAASWCQMTNAGLSGIKIDGKAAKMEDVISACNSRDIVTVMKFADCYLFDRWLLNGSPVMTRPVDVYLLLFAPAFVGKPDGTVLYQGYANPSYYMNAGLDGWFLDGEKIRYSAGQKDGRITVGEMGLRMEAMKNSLLSKYLK